MASPLLSIVGRYNPACTGPLCSTTERELFSIIEVLKKFENILLDQRDQRLSTEPQAENNVAADALSRLDMGDPKSPKKHSSQKRDAPNGIGIPKRK